MKPSDGGSAGRPEKRSTARSKAPHQARTGVTGRGTAPELSQDEGRLRRRGEVVADPRTS